MTHTNGEYNRLGDRIRKSSDNISSEDLEMLQDLRTSYKDDLAAIFSELVKVAKKVDNKAITTYRVKRIESIISKLHRAEKMKLSRMSDIAGCRCILNSNQQVYDLFDAIEPIFCVRTINDYIINPKDGGYKSLHLIVSKNADCNKTIEIQIRCRDDHNWATLVEITDLLYNTKIKEYGGGDSELAEFHRLLSSDVKLADRQTKQRIADIAARNKYFTRISDVFSNNYIDVRNKWNEAKSSRCKFFLISTGKDGSPEILCYNNFNDAEQTYFEMYQNNILNKNIVLTHINNVSFEDISLAYSNYFLTYNDLVIKCYNMISDLVVSEYKDNNYLKFGRMYNMFVGFTMTMLDNQAKDMLEYNKKKSIKKTLKKQKEWAESIKQTLSIILKKFAKTDSEMDKLKGRVFCGIIKNIIFFTRVRLLKK